MIESLTPKYKLSETLYGGTVQETWLHAWNDSGQPIGYTELSTYTSEAVQIGQFNR